MKKTKKRGSGFSPACLLLLLPTVIFGAYVLAMELGFIPEEVKIGTVTIEFFALGENVLMGMLEKVCFIWLPVLFVAVLVLVLIIGHAYGKKNADGAEEETDPFAKVDKNGKKDKRSKAEPDRFEASFTDGEGSSEDADKEPEADFAALNRVELEFSGRRSERRTGEYPAIQLKDVVRDVKEYAASKGVELPERAARSIIASVAAGRMLVLDEKYKDKNRAVINAVAAYFGGAVHPHTAEAGYYSAEHLATVVDPDKRVKETGLLIDIYSACFEREKMRFALLENIDCNTVSGFFSEYREALEGGIGEKFITATKLFKGAQLQFMKDGRVPFPENLILTVSTAFTSDAAKLSGEVIYPDLSGIVPRPASAYKGGNAIARPQLMKAAERARESYYLTDGYWNGIDLLEAYLNSLIGYRLDNRKVRMMERYSSVYMAAGGSEAEALDSTLTACILSGLYARRGQFNLSADVEAPYEFLERVFGAETVPASIEMVRRLCGSSAKTEEKAKANAAEPMEPEQVTETVNAVGELTDQVSDADEDDEEVEVADVTEEQTDTAETAEVETAEETAEQDTDVTESEK